MADYSAEQRRRLLREGKALRSPSGGPPRFPIVTRADVANAVRLAGHGSGDKQLIRRFILRRARALGALDLIPDDWTR